MTTKSMTEEQLQQFTVCSECKHFMEEEYYIGIPCGSNTSKGGFCEVAEGFAEFDYVHGKVHYSFDEKFLCKNINTQGKCEKFSDKNKW